jgi:glycosyltransferase involved in cell wall biosynthesis
VRIGVFPAPPGKGGVYQYSLSMLAALDPGTAASEGDELFVLSDRSSSIDVEALARAGWRVVPPGPPPTAASRARTVTGAWVRRAVGDGKLRRALRAARRTRPADADLSPPDPTVVRRRPELTAWHARLGLELMLYPSPVTYSFEAGTPYVIAVHDLQHRLQPEFPEVSADGQAEGREYLFRNAIARATLILADSEVGKEDVLELYGDVGVTPDRVKVLPFVPPPYVLEGGRADETAVGDVRRRYSLPDRYFYYPAQFWPHKNHARLLQALALIERDRGAAVSVVFSGSRTSEIRKRTHRELLQLAVELGVAARVHDLGYVPEHDVGPLYRGAVALVMPTFFGPTNIPVLEAWSLECPVLTSDIRGIREQVADAGVLVDPRSVEELADGMHRLWTNDALRRELAARGQARLAEYTPEDFRARLADIVTEAKERIKRAAA